MMEVRFDTSKDFEPIDTEEKWQAVRAAGDAYWEAVRKLSASAASPASPSPPAKAASPLKRRNPAPIKPIGPAAPIGQRLQDYAEKALRATGRPLDEEDLARAMEVAGCTKMSPTYARLIAPVLSKEAMFAREDGKWALAEWATTEK